MIDITRDGNPSLVEKAGREGFRENRAYRQLKRLLEHFFIQLAAEFFREGGLRSDEFIRTRASWSATNSSAASVPKRYGFAVKSL